MSLPVIGFLGLGIMGAPMAGNLLAAGYRVRTASHSKPVPDALRDAGAKIFPDAQAVAEGADIVILMVPDTPQVEAVLFGARGVAAGLRPGGLVIDMSSIAPAATRDFAARIKAQGGGYVDAPVSGGEIGAINRTLTIMAGGAPADFERARPVLEALGKTVTLIAEENGAGQACKAANQIIVALNLEAVAEAFVFLDSQGVPKDVVRKALLGGFASSRVLEVHGERMINRNFTPGFKTKLHLKDLDIALAEAAKAGLTLPNLARTRQLLADCVDPLGGAENDHSFVLRAVEALSETH
jgi:2-hydroxy-3-oxopropionate reductase